MPRLQQRAKARAEFDQSVHEVYNGHITKTLPMTIDKLASGCDRYAVIGFMRLVRASLEHNFDPERTTLAWALNEMSKIYPIDNEQRAIMDEVMKELFEEHEKG